MVNTERSESETSNFFDVVDNGRPLRLHYNAIGDGDETVVMLHGSGPGASGWANFSRNVDPFVSAGFRVVLLDFPGWNKSDTVICDESRPHLNARMVLALLDHLNVEQAHLIGNSMGAHSAVVFALTHPTRVGKLILMGGGTGGAASFTPMPTEGIKLIGALYRDPTIENLKRMMNVFVYDPSALTEELLNIRLNNLRARPDHLENFVESARVHPQQYPDMGHRLSELHAPTLIIWGRDDRFVPVETGIRLLAGLPNAELHVFSRCGHWAQWEHADAFNRMALDFLYNRRA
ncbi:alpha/beta fold hydrolase [Pigmentiphaga sp. GD03639]|uniref:alpha/beta fold hydrolase n=1 Tax=Pigmentiphaga sp. GD03639 TaxID=2975354 RepID=UPI002448F32C|nr:alpha/beta fold hydrolase [Pigmentiphaga sp. GD03639]MDH2235043.1 alpha/beta fold hydrolase [Pigmentiphaga sp. GD03639]